MTSHYDTLGIPPDASPEEIKHAYRKRARKAHPDKGGSTAEMALVNTANDVLSSPERRARYDRGECTAPKKTPEELARDTFMEFLSQCIDKEGVDVIEEVEANITRTVLTIEAEILRAQKTREILLRRREHIHTSDERNLAHMIIDQRVEQLDKYLEQANDVITKLNMAQDLCESYSSTEIITVPPMQQYAPSVWTFP